MSSCACPQNSTYAANYGGGNGVENGTGNSNAVDGIAPGSPNVPNWSNTPNLGPFHSRDGSNNRYGAPIADILDGTSNTVAIGEILHMPASNNGDCRGAWGRHACAYISAYANAFVTDGPQWIVTPNSPPDTAPGGNSRFRDEPPYCDNNARGELRCNDGSVRFVSENIDRVVYRAILTIRGGEVVGEF